MSQVTDTDVVMKLIVPSGNARSEAIRAIELARKGSFDEAEDKIEAAQQSLNEAHECQSEIIRAALNGEGESAVSLVMAHGQDHLMNAITICELAKQMVLMMRESNDR